MALTANEKLLRDVIRHKVDIQRYGNGVVNNVLALLAEGEKDLEQQILLRVKDNWTTRRLNSILRELTQINLDNYNSVQNRVKKEMKELANHEAEVSAASIEKQTVVLSIVQPSAQQLAAIASKEPITVGPDGKLLLEEIFQSLAFGREEKIRQAVRLGMVEGETGPQIVRRLIGTRKAKYADGIINGNRRAATAMVRTIVNHVSNKAAQMTYDENSDILSGLQWVATLDTSTCVVCITYENGGKAYPVDSGPRPPVHVGDRCFMAPVLKSWQELGIKAEEIPQSTRASMNGQVAESMTYPEWLREHPEYAAEVLGSTRAKLFLNGKMPISSFVDDNGNTLTLAELRDRSASYFKKAGLD